MLQTPDEIPVRVGTPKEINLLFLEDKAFTDGASVVKAINLFESTFTEKILTSKSVSASGFVAPVKVSATKGANSSDDSDEPDPSVVPYFSYDGAIKTASGYYNNPRGLGWGV